MSEEAPLVKGGVLRGTRYDGKPPLPIETYAPQIPENDTDDPFPEWHQLDPDPRNPKITGGLGSSRTGRLSPIDQFALAEARQEAISMSKSFLETCPNDWGGGYGINAKGVLNNLIEGKKPSETSHPEVNPIAMMRFRWKAAQGADNLVACFGLPVPDKQYCLMWDQFYSLEERQSQIPNYSDKYSSAFHFIFDGPMSPQPIESLQGFPFPRFAQYVAIAVVLAGFSSEKQDELLNSMSDFVLKERKTPVRSTSASLSIPCLHA